MHPLIDYPPLTTHHSLCNSMTDTVLTYLDGYCERAGQAGMLAEPLNLFTNLFFIVAAVLAGRALMRTPATGRRVDLWFLVGFLFSIGIGSGLWHAHPIKPTMLMDVIPITLFINLFILSTLRRLIGLGWSGVALLWAVYFGAGILAQAALPPDLLNGSIMYVPTYLMLAIMTAVLMQRDRMVGIAFLQALLVFTASLTFRTLDMQLCKGLVSGTHFLWHTLNAWLLWRLLMAMVHKTAK